MEHQQLMNLILKELPTLMESHHAFRESVVSISRVHFADKAQTENRFDSMITRLDRSMEQWEEHHFVLAKLTTAFEKIDQRLDQKIEEDRQKWAANQQQLEKHEQQIARLTSALEKLEQRLEQKIEEDRQKWTENQQQLEKHEQQIARLTSTLEKLEQRLDQKIEEDRQKWAENQQLWAENQKRLENLEQRLEQKIKEDRQKWAATQQQLEKHEQQIAKLTSALKKLEQRLDQKIEEDRQKWAENQQLWAENQQRWAENQQKWKEHERQMETNQQQMNAKIDSVFSKVDQKLGALGARWGIQSEASFRNALAGILKEFEEIEVIHVDEHDDQGIVFGYPEEIELDLIIKNGLLMIAEMKSSVEKFHIALFERKVRFYEQKHNRQANRKIVISPMVNDKAISLAKQLDIEVYTYVQDVNL